MTMKTRGVPSLAGETVEFEDGDRDRLGIVEADEGIVLTIRSESGLVFRRPRWRVEIRETSLRLVREPEPGVEHWAWVVQFPLDGSYLGADGTTYASLQDTPYYDLGEAVRIRERTLVVSVLVPVRVLDTEEAGR